MRERRNGVNTNEIVTSVEHNGRSQEIEYILMPEEAKRVSLKFLGGSYEYLNIVVNGDVITVRCGDV